jgi:hypothetical protein
MGKSLTREQSLELNRRRWERDNAGLDEYIDRLVKRAPALSVEQVERLRALLPAVPGRTDGGGDRAA